MFFMHSFQGASVNFTSALADSELPTFGINLAPTRLRESLSYFFQIFKELHFSRKT